MIIILKSMSGRWVQIRQFARYSLSGFAAAITHFLILALLIEFIALNATLASAAGFCAAIVVNYTLQYYWTFRAKESHYITLLRYIFVTSFMFIVNISLFWVLNSQILLHYLIAQSITTALVMLGNYGINRHYTFSARRTTKKMIIR